MRNGAGAKGARSNNQNIYPYKLRESENGDHILNGIYWHCAWIKSTSFDFAQPNQSNIIIVVG